MKPKVVIGLDDAGEVLVSLFGRALRLDEAQAFRDAFDVGIDG